MSTGHRQHRVEGVFISYRRGETSGQARALHERLGQHFGRERVFMDVDSISPGADFVEKIEEAISSSAVVLVLIGRDWVSRRPGERLFDDPTDFVRMETDTALRSGVPVIPILVERATMPEPADLPEDIRPITRRSALELENQRWEYDVNRLVHVVEEMVDAGKHKERAGPESEQSRDDEGGKSRRRLSRRTIAIAGAAAVAVVIAVVLLLSLSSGPSPVGASAAVAAVAPDRLALQLLGHRFAASELPSSVGTSAPYLAVYRPFGLVASVAYPLTGAPSSQLYVDYEIFDNVADAGHYYSVSTPLADGYSLTGSFSAKGVADQSKCVTGHSSQFAEWDWSCLTLSSTVVSFSVVNDSTDNGSSDQSLAQQLAVSAISHLKDIAKATPAGAAPAPPGKGSASELFNSLLSTAGLNNLLPYGLQSTPLVQSFSLGSKAPAGLVKNTYVYATLSGTKSDYHDYVTYYVFSSSHAASAWYGTDLRPSQSTPTGTSIDSSGFTQAISCATFDKSEATSSAVIAACVIDWGNVTVLTESWRAATATNPLSYNETVAVTLARMAILELESLDAR